MKINLVVSHLYVCWHFARSKNTVFSNIRSFWTGYGSCVWLRTRLLYLYAWFFLVPKCRPRAFHGVETPGEERRKEWKSSKAFTLLSIFLFREIFSKLSLSLSLSCARQSAWFCRNLSRIPEDEHTPGKGQAGNKTSRTTKANSVREGTRVGERARASSWKRKSKCTSSESLGCPTLFSSSSSSSSLYCRFFFLPRSSFGLQPTAYSAISLERNFPGIRPTTGFRFRFLFSRSAKLRFLAAAAVNRCISSTRQRASRERTLRLTPLRDIYLFIIPFLKFTVVVSVIERDTTRFLLTASNSRITELLLYLLCTWLFLTGCCLIMFIIWEGEEFAWKV